MDLLTLRFRYFTDTTIGKLYIVDKNGPKYFGYTLEDQIRPPGIKIYGKTAIDENIYKLGIRYSPKFKREVIHILNVPGFRYVYFHTLNTHEETEGCIGVASKVFSDRIQCSLEKKLFNLLAPKIKAGIDCHLTIKNIREVNEYN